jgi:hypothetical protein
VSALSATSGRGTGSSLARIAFILLVSIGFPAPARGTVCKVQPARARSEAELVFLKGDHAKAAEMLQADLAKTPNDPDKAALLTRALLWQRKAPDAEAVLTNALAAHPDSATLLAERAEVLFRQGKPWEVGEALSAAINADPCFPRVFVISAWLMDAESNHASARKAILTAYQLDPNDPEIRRYWMNTLSLKEHIAALESWIASGTITDTDLLGRMQKQLESMKKREGYPFTPCSLVSATKSAELPLLDFLQQGTGGDLRVAGHELNVEINGRRASLQMDTHASGLWLSRSKAEHAGLKLVDPALVPAHIGPNTVFREYAEQIRVGDLVFKDCAVHVLNRGYGDQDGAIGADVFSQFVVTIDYPMRKFRLDPLPTPPNQQASESPELAAGDGEDSGSADNSSQTAGIAPPLTDRYIAPEMKDWTQIYRVAQRLIILGSIRPPEPRLFLLDAELRSTTVDPEVAREVTKVSVDPKAQIVRAGPQALTVYIAEAVDLKFSGISKHEMAVPAVSLDRESMYSAMRISALLGADILEELTIHIDYRDGLIKFEYNPSRGYHPPNR